MKITWDNLPEGVRASVAEDLAAAAEAASRCGRALPDADLRLVALARGGEPAGVPRHGVAKPEGAAPSSFHRRCDWETRRQSFEIVRDGRTVWVLGGDTEGAYRGFGEALQCLAGVIWGGLLPEDVLIGEPRPLPRGVQSPRFAYRCRDGSPPSGSFEDFIRWLSRNKYNAKVFTSSHRARQKPEDVRRLTAFLESRCMHQIVGYHAMDFWLPPEALAAHPEWRGMRGGERVEKAQVTIPDCPNLSAVLPIQPCYSNPGAAELIVSRMAAHAAAHPEIEILSLWPHDGVNNWCECPECLKKTPYEHLYDLALRLLPRLPPAMPIELIAYSNLLNPPFRELARSDRIIGMLCPYLRPFRHRVFDPGGPAIAVTGTCYPAPDRINPLDEREYGLIFQRWSQVWREAGSVPGIFEYGGGFPDETRRYDSTRYFCLPEPGLRRDEAAWYAARGVRYFYMCSGYNGWPDNFLQLDFARTLWGHEEPEDDAAARYYEALVGPGGDAVRRALRRVAKSLHREEASWREDLDAFDEAVRRLPPSPPRRRYELWSRYVRLARPARDLELAQDYPAAIEQERQVQAFLDEHEPELKTAMAVAQARRLSTTFAQRHAERLGGKADREYRL